MADDLGKPFVIENKAGAGGIIATDAVAKAAPDGYTLLLTTPNHTINAGAAAVAALRHREGPRAGLGRRRGAGGAGQPSRRAVHDFAGVRRPTPRSNPGKLNYASAGIGTLPHVTMELLLRRTGIQVAHIPYRGAAPAMTDLLAGLVQLKLDTYATSNPQVAAGKLRMLGIASRHRSKLMPDTPTIAEMGLPGYEGILWIAHPGAGRHAAGRRSTSSPRRARRRPARRTSSSVCSATASSRSAARRPNSAQLIARELPQWRELAKAANIKLQ